MKKQSSASTARIKYSGNGIRSVEEAIAMRVPSDGYLGLPLLMTATKQPGKPFRHSDDGGRVEELIAKAFEKRRQRVENYSVAGNVDGRTVYRVKTNCDCYEVDMRANGSKVLAVRRLRF